MSNETEGAVAASDVATGTASRSDRDSEESPGAVQTHYESSSACTSNC